MDNEWEDMRNIMHALGPILEALDMDIRMVDYQAGVHVEKITTKN